MLPRRRLHQWVFVIAGLYNILWGLFSSLRPQWLFTYAEMKPSSSPEIFACLAMVVGLYGLVYFEVARVPERGWVLAAVGLVGKLLGPIGLAVLIGQGVWPPATVILCLTNDIIWWIPFTLYLYDARAWFLADLRSPAVPTPPAAP